MENNKQQKLKHRYPTRITQLSQEINKVKSTSKTATRHQQCLIYVHEQVKATPQLIDNCLKYNMIRHPRTMTQHDYITKMANAIIDDYTVKELNYCQLSKHPKHQKIWKQSFANELGRLAHGAGGRMEGTYTMFFIAQYQVPRDRLKDVTYGRIVVDYRLYKEEPHRTRLTGVGNLIVYAGDIRTPMADTTTSKLIINITISTPGARYMCCDKKYIYLGTPLSRY